MEKKLQWKGTCTNGHSILSELKPPGCELQENSGVVRVGYKCKWGLFCTGSADVYSNHPLWPSSKSPPFTPVGNVTMFLWQDNTSPLAVFTLKLCRKSVKQCKTMWFTALFETKAEVLRQSECRISVKIYASYLQMLHICILNTSTKVLSHPYS